MVTTNSDAISQVCRSYQFRGQDFALPGEQFALPYGKNIRMPELSALLGVLQYKRLDEFIARRLAVAEIYNRILSQDPGLQVPPVIPESRHAYWLYTVVLPRGTDRELLRARCLEQWNVTISWSYFPPLHLMPVFKNLYGCREGNLPAAEDVLSRIVCLPVHPHISDSDATYAAECFLEVFHDLRDKR